MGRLRRVEKERRRGEGKGGEEEKRIGGEEEGKGVVG